MKKPLLIGFGHRKRVGKDTAGSVLTNNFGFRRVAFADRIKAAVSTIWDLTPEQFDGDQKEVVIPRLGFSSRDAFKRFGESMRVEFGKDVWVNIALQDVDRYLVSGQPVVVTDVRRLNEAQSIKDRGGILVHIERPSIPKTDFTHPTENELEDYKYDFEIVNDGTLTEFQLSVVSMFRGFEVTV